MRKLIYICIAFTFLNCAQKEKEILLNGQALGTTYQVKFYSNEIFDVETKFDSVIEAVNQSMSTYRPNSDISRINKGDSTVLVDEMFKEVFSLSQKIYEETNGYYDPTVGILVNAYGFGPDKPLNKLDSTTIDSLKQYVGLGQLKLSPKGTIYKSNKAVYLDFNSIAKGYCIDRIGSMLEKNGVDNYLIELGGELLAKGKNLTKNKPWAVGIENINAPIIDRSYTGVVYLNDYAMAGSGNYRKYRLDSISGKRYVHTINPLTGLAEKSDVLSATVIAQTCAEADAYATAFMAMGLQRSKTVLGKVDGVDAYLLYAVKDSSQVFMTPGFKKFLKN